MTDPSVFLSPPASTEIHHPPPPSQQVDSTNPGYAAASVVQNHPPYEQMILAAIEAMNETNGSSRQAIAKYIEQVYTSLPESHSGMLTQVLKKMRNTGQLVMDKHSYMIAGPAAAVSTQDTLMRIAKFGNNGNLDLNGTGQEVMSVVKRGRGRPPKVRLDVDENGTVRRTAGRPRKPVSQTMPLRRGRGRPRKDATNGVYVLNARRPGRPPKVGGPGRKYMKVSGRPVGRPKINGKAVLGPVEPKWAVDYALARAKIQYFQTRLQLAIAALKPQMANEISNDLRLATALQELDQLSTIDIMATSFSNEGDQEPHQPAEKMNESSITSNPTVQQ